MRPSMMALARSDMLENGFSLIRELRPGSSTGQSCGLMVLGDRGKGNCEKRESEERLWTCRSGESRSLRVFAFLLE